MLVAQDEVRMRQAFYFPITSIATGIVFGGRQTSLSHA
jgi:hypothetical protein